MSISYNCTVLPKAWNPCQFCRRAQVRWAGRRRQGFWSPACTTLCVFGWVSFCRPLDVVIVKLPVLLWHNFCMLCNWHSAHLKHETFKDCASASRGSTPKTLDQQEFAWWNLYTRSMVSVIEALSLSGLRKIEIPKHWHTKAVETYKKE